MRKHPIKPKTLTESDNIATIVDRLIGDTIEKGEGQRMLAHFTHNGHVNGHFAGIGYHVGDIYDIILGVAINKTVQEVLLHIKYEVVAANIGEDSENKLTGVFKDQNGVDIGKETLSSLLTYPVPEPMHLTLYEVGFTPSTGRYHGKREVMYQRKTRENQEDKSRLVATFYNLGRDVAAMVPSLYTHEPSLDRFRRSSLTPWLFFGVAAAATVKLIDGVMGIVSYLISK